MAELNRKSINQLLDQMLAMSSKERVAYMKSVPPEEREAIKSALNQELSKREAEEMVRSLNS